MAPEMVGQAVDERAGRLDVDVPGRLADVDDRLVANPTVENRRRNATTCSSRILTCVQAV